MNRNLFYTGGFMSKIISVLGATGSVGTQALDVARARGYKVDLLTAGKNTLLAEALAREFRPKIVAMQDEQSAKDLKCRLCDTNIEVLSSEEGIIEGILRSESEVAINSILGEAGLRPTLAVIEAKKRLALANKESLVIAGNIVMAKAREQGVEILPVDSEHSAIYQSLKSGKQSEIKNIILTASGGPFFGKSKAELESVTLADTLAHPTWKMGRKITIDSATLMNKGFEIVEAAHLFSVSADKIKVVIHRESILHSAIEYIDNSVIGEFSVPDMRMCVQYAVDYPDRMPSESDSLDLVKLGSLSFFAPDFDAFPLLPLSVRAMNDGGASCAVMNAADEVCVDAFLNEKIKFTQISEAVISTYESIRDAKEVTSLDGIIEKDREARSVAREILRRI